MKKNIIKSPSLVTTIRGDLQKRTNCRKIKNEYYLENRDCFLVNGRWNRVNNGLIVLDIDINEWVLKNTVNQSQKTLFILDHIGDTVVFGITLNEYRLIKMGAFSFIDYDQVEGITPVVETILDEGAIININDYSKNTNNPLHSAIHANRDNNFLNLDISDNVWSELKGYTYGVELEATEGNVFNIKTLLETTMYPVKDGSLKGGVEYTTDIISNKLYLSKLKKFCDYAEKYDVFPNIQNGSLHVHIGGVSLTKRTFLSLYCLCYKLQTDIKEFNPPYRNTHSYLYNKNKDKDYCKELPKLELFKQNLDIEEKVDIILTWLNEGVRPTSNNNFTVRNHPKQGSSKWRFSGRYYMFNFISYFYDSKETIEFRSHHMTFNFSDIYSWMIICKSIIDYALNNVEECISNTKIELLDIIPNNTPITKAVVEYVMSRINNTVESQKRHNSRNNLFFPIKHIKI